MDIIYLIHNVCENLCDMYTFKHKAMPYVNHSIPQIIFITCSIKYMLVYNSMEHSYDEDEMVIVFSCLIVCQVCVV